MIADLKEKVDKPFENFLQQFTNLADRGRRVNAEATSEVLNQFNSGLVAFLTDVASAYKQGRLPTESQIIAAHAFSQLAGQRLGALFSGKDSRGASTEVDLGAQALLQTINEFKKIQAQCPRETLGDTDRKAYDEVAVKMATWSDTYAYFYAGVLEGIK
jgi:hypothetical protein